MLLLWTLLLSFGNSVIVIDKRGLESISNNVIEDVISTTEKEMEPSLVWASTQISAMIPTDYQEPDTPITLNSPKELISVGTNTEPIIQKVLVELGANVIKALRPGLEKSLHNLIRKRANDPDGAAKLITQQELAEFVLDLTRYWTEALNEVVSKWSNTNLPRLLNFVGGIIGGIGGNILRQLGRLANFVLNQGREEGCPRHFSGKEKDMVDWVKATSTKVASASLTFVTAPGYLSRTISQAFIKHDVQKWM